MTLMTEMTTRLVEKLQRASSRTCSKYAENYIVLGKPIPGPLRFSKHPWSKDMFNCESDWVGMKAAQMAYSQTAIARAIFTIDVKKTSVLYVLPKKSPDASDFSRSKFNPIVQNSPYLSQLFPRINNVGHKQALNGADLFIRGARSRSGLKAISTGVIIWDEFDEMPKGIDELGEERSSGFMENDRQNIYFSTPTVPEFGIAKKFEETTQDHFFFSCPSCSRFEELTYPDSLVITADSLNDPKLLESHLICKQCKAHLPHESKEQWLASAKWVSAFPDRPVRGFQIPQMYSIVQPVHKIAALAIRARQDPLIEVSLYNNKLGLPRALEGARITDEDLAKCFKNYTRKDLPPKGQFVTMGVDVGHKTLYYWIDQWFLPPHLGPDLNTHAACRNLTHGNVDYFSDLEELLNTYQVLHTVIDVDPDFRGAFDFARTHPGRVNLCRLLGGRSVQQKNMIPKREDLTVMVNRTAWLDVSQQRFKRQTIQLPKDSLSDVSLHLKALIRHPTLDDDGNPVVKYLSVAADHFAFSRLYSEIAMPLAAAIQSNQDVAVYL